MSTPRTSRKASVGPPQSEAAAALAEMAAEAAALAEAAGGSVTETVARWLAPQYAVVAKEQLETLSGSERMKFLGVFVRDWSLLRRGEQTGTRLQLDRERLDHAKGRTEREITEKFLEWIDKPQVKRIINGGLSEQERARRIRELFGVAPEPQKGLSPETLVEIEAALKIL